MPYIKIKLDIESELELIENLLVGYIQDDRDVNGNVFLPFLRFPGRLYRVIDPVFSCWQP